MRSPKMSAFEGKADICYVGGMAGLVVPPIRRTANQTPSATAVPCKEHPQVARLGT